MSFQSENHVNHYGHTAPLGPFAANPLSPRQGNVKPRPDTQPLSKQKPNSNGTGLVQRNQVRGNGTQGANGSSASQFSGGGSSVKSVANYDFVSTRSNSFTSETAQSTVSSTTSVTTSKFNVQAHTLASSAALASLIADTPWLRFSIVAKPDLSLFAQDENLRKFVTELTELAIQTIMDQLRQELTASIDTVINNLSKNSKQQTAKMQDHQEKAPEPQVSPLYP
ncbi:hypothetical protein CVT24_002467, partial [Panaeolus cyanescens]